MAVELHRSKQVWDAKLKKRPTKKSPNSWSQGHTLRPHVLANPAKLPSPAMIKWKTCKK